MLYDKKIKYVDVYEKGEKVQNVGFVKMEARENNVMLWIQLSGLKVTDTMNCPVVLLGAGKEAVLGEIYIERGKGVAEFTQLNGEDMAGGIGYASLEEIHIRPAGTRLFRCVVQLQERKREIVVPESDPLVVRMATEDMEVAMEEHTTGEMLQEPVESGEEERPQEPVESGEKGVQQTAVVKSEAELLKEAFLAEKRLREGDGTDSIQQNISAPALDVVDEGVKVPTEKPTSPVMQPTVVQEPQPVDKWQQLLAIYPHIRPFEDRREYLLMKPQDFVVLADKYFSLSGNSFLLHGYYNYDHLIMSKERRPEGERFYIGVPGNFYDKEKQVAIMFGFESFEGKREPARTGDFGYYLIPVEI